MIDRGDMPIITDNLLFVQNDRQGLKKEFLFGLLAAVVALLVYANSLGNGFVWDDNAVITGNPAVKGSALSLFRGIDTTRMTEPTQYYRPLTLLSFLVEDRLHGLTPFCVRLANILLHAANTLLLYLLARTLFTSRHASLLVALLFAVHPVHTEGVDFNSGGRNTMLALFFVLSAYLLHSRSVARANISGAYAGALMFLAGLLSKEFAVCILPFILAAEVPARVDRSPGRDGQLVARLTPYVVLLGLYVFLRNNALAMADVKMEIFPGLLARLQDDIYIIPRYLLTIVWPFALTSKYFIPDDLHALALPLFAAWFAILMSIGWLLARERSRATLFGISWAVSFWLPVSGIVSIASDPLADRYLYAPAIGLWIVAADQGLRMIPANVPWRRIAQVSMLIILVMLSLLTIRRNLDWRDDFTYFSRFVEEYPDRAFGYHNLGCAYLDKKRDLDGAEREFTKALSIDPAFPRLRTQLGYVSLLRGDYQRALVHYDEAVKLNLLDTEALLNRGIALERLGRYTEAVTSYRLFLNSPINELRGARPYAEERINALSGK